DRRRPARSTGSNAMSFPERPQLHPFLQAVQDHSDPRFVILWDRLNTGTGPQRVTQLEFHCLRLFDGRRTLREVQAEMMPAAGGRLLPLELFPTLVQKLDEARFLDGPRFREALAGPVREPACIGCYSGNPETLRQQLRRLFTDPGGPGLPREPQPDGRLRA